MDVAAHGALASRAEAVSVRAIAASVLGRLAPLRGPEVMAMIVRRRP